MAKIGIILMLFYLLLLFSHSHAFYRKTSHSFFKKMQNTILIKCFF